MPTLRVMLLSSEDGQQYARVVIPPQELSVNAAESLAATVIDDAIAANPDEYDWETIAAKLIDAGFQIPFMMDGPRWDCRS